MLSFFFLMHYLTGTYPVICELYFSVSHIFCFASPSLRQEWRQLKSDAFWHQIKSHTHLKKNLNQSFFPFSLSRFSFPRLFIKINPFQSLVFQTISHPLSTHHHRHTVHYACFLFFSLFLPVWTYCMHIYFPQTQRVTFYLVVLASAEGSEYWIASSVSVHTHKGHICTAWRKSSIVHMEFLIPWYPQFFLYSLWTSNFSAAVMATETGIVTSPQICRNSNWVL